jgi:hypothetical protein
LDPEPDRSRLSPDQSENSVMSYRITDRVIPGIEEEELRNSELGNSFIVIQYLGSTFSFEVRLFCLLYFG